FDATGNFIKEISVSDSALFAVHSSVARNFGGSFAIAYDVLTGGGNYEVHLSNYDKDGNLLWPDQVINPFSTDINLHPSVSLDDTGNSVVAYEAVKDGHVARISQRINNAGVQGVALALMSPVSDFLRPVVALSRGGDGKYALAYQDQTSTDTRVEVSEV